MTITDIPKPVPEQRHVSFYIPAEMYRQLETVRYRSGLTTLSKAVKVALAEGLRHLLPPYGVPGERERDGHRGDPH